MDLVLEFRTGKKWAIEIKRGLSPSISKGFYNALEDLKADQSFIVSGGNDRFKIKNEVEMISLDLIQKELLGMSAYK